MTLSSLNHFNILKFSVTVRVDSSFLELESWMSWSFLLCKHTLIRLHKILVIFKIKFSSSSWQNLQNWKCYLSLVKLPKNAKTISLFIFTKIAKWKKLLKHQRNFLTDFWVNLSEMSTLLDSLQLSSDWICGNPWLGRFYHRSKLSLASILECGQLSTIKPTLN